MKISNSAVLILTSAVFSFTNSTLAIVSFSLGVIGAIISYTVKTSENHQKVKEVEWCCFRRTVRFLDGNVESEMCGYDYNTFTMF